MLSSIRRRRGHRVPGERVPPATALSNMYARGKVAVLQGRIHSTANSGQRPGTSRRWCVPRSLKRIPAPTTVP